MTTRLNIVFSYPRYLTLNKSVTPNLISIVVDTPKRSKELLYVPVLIAFAITVFYPAQVHASVLSSFADKVKAIFLDPKDTEDNNQVFATSQTMALFKPTVIEEGSTSLKALEVDNEKESLQAISGSLRMSTEDIDFPTTDTISVYEVKKGDTITDVAKLFDVSVNTIMWANDLKSKTIVKGDVLVILPITGIKHTIKKGDTVGSLAKKYKADADDIAKYNGISADSVLALGETLLVPDGEVQVVAPKVKTKTTTAKILDKYVNVAPGGFFTRPLIGGRRTQGIHGHNAVDIAATPGTPVIAAATGRVIAAKMGGYNGGYGNMIIIAHDNGIQTVYAHLRDVYVTQGQSVNQGLVIGEVGNSGRSSGPHLHFEVRGAKNPF